jgi:hypothetical protein
MPDCGLWSGCHSGREPRLHDWWRDQVLLSTRRWSVAAQRLRCLGHVCVLALHRSPWAEPVSVGLDPVGTGRFRRLQRKVYEQDRLAVAAARADGVTGRAGGVRAVGWG